MMRPLKDLSILVTGGGSGLGEGIARHFAAGGARVTISGRRAERLRQVAESAAGAIATVTGDVTDPEARHAMLATAVEHGGGRLDVLVNNAGNMYRGPLETLEAESVRDVFESNVIAPLMLTQAAYEHLRATRGAVIFISSVHTQRAFPGASPYAATKGAIEALTGVLAAELGQHQIRVSCIRPGGILTEINQRAGFVDDEGARARLEALAPAHALGRIGTAEEIAEAVDYLARAEWVTGAILDVDGGLALGVTNA